MNECQTCANGDSCLTCITKKVQKGNQCIDKCPENGFYEQNKKCKQCNSDCLKCTSLVICT